MPYHFLHKTSASAPSSDKCVCLYLCICLRQVLLPRTGTSEVSFIESRTGLFLFYPLNQIRALQLLLKSVSFLKRMDISNVHADLDFFRFMNIFPFAELKSCLNILAISRLNINNIYRTPT